MSHDDVDGQGNDRLVAIAQFLKPQEVFIHLHRRQTLYDFSRCIIARTEQSSIYIAKKVEGFKPVRVNVRNIVLLGLSWKVFRTPSLSPDLRTLYFSVPDAGTSWRLMEMRLPNGVAKPIREAALYCV